MEDAVPSFVCMGGVLYFIKGVPPHSGNMFCYISLEHLNAGTGLSLLGGPREDMSLLGEMLIDPLKNLEHICKVFEDGIEPYRYIYPRSEQNGLMKNVYGLNAPFEEFIVKPEDVRP